MADPMRANDVMQALLGPDKFYINALLKIPIYLWYV